MGAHVAEPGANAGDEDIVRGGLGSGRRAADAREGPLDSMRHVAGTHSRSTLDGFGVHERPRRVALLPRLLTEEAGELTPSMKTKNRVVVKNWADKIAYLFDDKTPAS